jgi:hypothetical protein
LSGGSRSTARDGILVVTDRRFWRRSIGSEQRIATLVRHLAKRPGGVTVAYVGRIPRSERPRVAACLDVMPGLEILSRRSGARALAQSLGRVLAALFAPVPTRRGSGQASGVEAPSKSSPARRAFVAALIERRAPRVVIVEFLRLGYTVLPRSGSNAQRAELLIDTHDVLHRRAERARARGAHVDHPIDAAEEMRRLAAYDAVMAIQETEAALLRAGLPETPVLLVPHGFEASAAPLPIAATRPIRIGFLGGRDASNVDALDWFVHEIWPAIRARFADQVELHVAGQVTRAWDAPGDGIRILGPVAAVDDFWCAIDIAVNPVRFGSGLKIKNVEALAHGRALLTTTLGAEGLETAAPEGLRIADTATEWIDALAEWLAQPEIARAVARRGLAHAAAHLSERAAFAELDAHLDRGLDRRPAETSNATRGRSAEEGSS